MGREAPGHAAKRKRLTWSLAAVLACLVAAIVFLERRDNSAVAEPTRVADDVQVITITQAGKEPIQLERGEDLQYPWSITAPVQLPANEQRILPLLTMYTNPDPGYALSSVDLIATGLDTPEVTVVFNDYEVKIGQLTVDGSRRHALYATRVRFVPDWVLPFLQGGVSALADLRLWGDGLTRISGGSGERFDAEALAAATTLVAQQYVSWPRADNPPILSERALTVETGDTRTKWVAYATDQYAAIQAAGTGYAYIVPLDEVPWLFPPR